MTIPTPLRWRPLGIALGLALGVRAVLLVLSPELSPNTGDEGFLVSAEVFRTWLSGTQSSTTADNPLFALFWHAPGYSLLVAIASLVFADPGTMLAVLQSVAGIGTGLVVYLLLSRHLSRTFALVGALVIWLHPSMLYFEQQISSVPLCTLLCTLLAWRMLALFEAPGDAKLQWQAGLLLAPLPWLAAGGLALVPLVGAMGPKGSAGRCLGPAVALWLPAMLVTSLWLGMWTPLTLDVPTRVALGNNPVVGVGQGSLLGNPEALVAFRGVLEDKCGERWTRPRLRCEAGAARQIVVATTLDDPSGALRRVVFRIIETWAPDRGVLDALQSSASEGEGDSRIWQLLVALVLPPLHLGLLVGLAFAMISCYGRREVRFLLLATLAWTTPVLFSVGATSFRQPALPWVLCASLLAIATVARRSGSERRSES